ncbi:hypothetical protein UFOVP733_39 [uncultured Caudovirales phage]|uniref:Uncharacterized protein n=1 Tax=uncultured Caudovirales phage TaxID=2100421 RepID=A0A6J7X629_9CAUD|nr:hypothetical protein UFOVP733_39 [uncultured Caudovirales phage]CAB5224866.1 hypothetical protein UFOVP743_20 [uncultured Caudovirales phage]
MKETLSMLMDVFDLILPIIALFMFPYFMSHADFKSYKWWLFVTFLACVILKSIVKEAIPYD